MHEDRKGSEGAARGRTSLRFPNGNWTRRGMRLPMPGLRAAILAAMLCCWFTTFLPATWAQFWKPVNLVAEPARIRALAVNPANDLDIFLASPGGGIWETKDGGIYQWLPVFDSAASLQVCSLVLDPSSPSVLYAGTGDDVSPRPAQGVARSADGGRTWKLGLRFTNQPVCSLAVDPSNGAHILAGSAEGLFLTTNTGATWQKVLTNPITAVAFDGRGNVYAGELGPDRTGARDNILASSNDGGLTWTTLSLPVPTTTAYGPTKWVSILATGKALNAVVCYQVSQAFDVVSQTSNIVMDFYRSLDGGVTWSVAPGIGGALPPVRIFTDSTAQKLYVTGTKLLISQDQGNSWSTIGSPASQFHDGVFSGGLILLAGETGVALVPPTPGGIGGEIVLPVLPLGQFLGLTVDSSGNIWAGGPGGLFSPTTSAVTGAGIGSVAASSSTNSKNVFAAGNASVYRSTDGVTFSASTVIPPTELRAPFPPLALTPTNAATAFVAGQNLYRTTNSGATWSSFATINPNSSNVVIALAISPSGARTMYAATACLAQVSNNSSCSNTSTIWQSTNTGATWSLKSSVQGYVNQLAGDQRQANTVYAAVGAFPTGPSSTAGYTPGNLLQSTDGGSTWTSIMGNLPQVPINSIVIDPTSLPTTTTTTPMLPVLPGGGGVVVGGGPGGIILFPPAPGANALNMPAQTLYVGTDAGVFVTFNAGKQWTAINQGLPPVQITRLSLQQPAGTLEAATFGRGVYQASVSGLGASVVAVPLSTTLSLNQSSNASYFFYLANFSAVVQNWQLTSLDPWLSAPQTSGTLQPGIYSTTSLQVSAANLALGTYVGRLQLTTGTQQQNILVTLQVTAPPGSLTITGGNNATGAVGTSVPPLVVSVTTASGGPLPGFLVRFAIVSGGGSLSTLSAITSPDGTASTVLTLPGSPGAVQVVATAGTLSATFTATAAAFIGPSLNANSVVNGVTFNSGTPPSPGSIISIFGQNLSTSNAQASDFPLPVSLQGTRVLMNNSTGEMALPLFYVSPLQINALVPFEASPGAYTLHVESDSAASNSIQISIAAFSPGIFTLTPNGQGMGIFIKADGTIASTSNPVAPGSVVSLFATGLGPVNPSVPSGQPGASVEPLNRTVQTPRVFFDIYQAQVLYSGLAPGYAGLYQVNVRVPSQVSPSSNIPVSLSIGGVASNQVAVPVQ